MDLDGEDLLDIFARWVSGLNASEALSDKRQTWIIVSSHKRWASRVELVELLVRAYGEDGDLVDIHTGLPVGKIEDNQAPTGENRVLLFVPEQGERAYYLVEESSHGSAGGHILRLFKTHFSQHTDRITMITASVTEGEALVRQSLRGACGR